MGGGDPIQAHYGLDVRTEVIVLNGGSSSGKTSIGRCLQTLLSGPWLLLGVDNLIEALPTQVEGDESSIVFESTGLVTVGPAFRRFEAAWYQGLASMARAGVGVIIDEVFLGGGTSQERLRSWLVDLDVAWVGVHCDPSVAATREAQRPKRIIGMAESQADMVYVGVEYDLQVDTTYNSALDCARWLAEHVVR
jgi:chloramphenicol 3-O phosphotransferase